MSQLRRSSLFDLHFRNKNRYLSFQGNTDWEEEQTYKMRREKRKTRKKEREREREKKKKVEGTRRISNLRRLFMQSIRAVTRRCKLPIQVKRREEKRRGERSELRYFYDSLRKVAVNLLFSARTFLSAILAIFHGAVYFARE